MGVFDSIKFPFLTNQQLNLDWILQEIKRVMGFFPEDGNVGTVLMKTEDGAAWEELAAVDININGVPEDTELTDTDKLIFYDISSSANRKITAPNLLNSMMSNGVPLMDGTGSAGTSKKPARYDHRHPTDTSRAPASYFQNNALKMVNGGTGATSAETARLNLELPLCGSAYRLATGTSVDITMENGEKGVIITSGNTNANKLFMLFNVTSTGGVSLKSVNPNDDLDSGTVVFTKTANKVSISNTSGNFMYVWKFSLYTPTE